MLLHQLQLKATTTPELNTNLFISGVSFSREDLSNVQLRNAVLDGCTFHRCNLNKTLIQGVSFRHCEFDECTLHEADAGRGITVVGATFTTTSFRDVHGEWRFTDCIFDACTFTGVQGSTIILDGESKLTSCNISELDIENGHDALVRASGKDKYVPWPDTASEDSDESDSESESADLPPLGESPPR